MFFLNNWIAHVPNRGKSLHFTFVTIGKEKPAVFAAGFECLKPEGPAL
jgi:hypothetical protein